MAESRISRIRKALGRLDRAWARSRLALVRVLLVAVVAVSLIAQVVPALGDYIAANKYLGFGIILALAYLLFETVISSVSDSPAIDSSIVLRHVSDLRPYLKQAFAAPDVELTIAAYSGETFYGLLSEFLNQVAEGNIRPQSLTIKLLVPDCSEPMGVPCRIGTKDEDPAYKHLIAERNRRFAQEFQNYFHIISTRYPAMNATMKIRLHRLSPLFKMIIVNGNRLFLGFYPIAETAATLEGERREFWDYRGERASFVGFSRNGTESEREIIGQMEKWFGVVWSKLAQEL